MLDSYSSSHSLFRIDCYCGNFVFTPLVGVASRPFAYKQRKPSFSLPPQRAKPLHLEPLVGSPGGGRGAQAGCFVFAGMRHSGGSPGGGRGAQAERRRRPRRRRRRRGGGLFLFCREGTIDGWSGARTIRWWTPCGRWNRWNRWNVRGGFVVAEEEGHRGG